MPVSDPWGGKELKENAISFGLTSNYWFQELEGSMILNIKRCQKQRIWSAIISPQIQQNWSDPAVWLAKGEQILGNLACLQYAYQQKINFGFLFLRMGCWCICRRNFEHPLDTQPLQHLSSQEVSWSHFFSILIKTKGAGCNICFSPTSKRPLLTSAHL